MKKKSLFLGGALMFAMTFSTTVLTSCHDDDKKAANTLPQPMQKAYTH